MKIVVVCGGDSNEREVSKKTGKAVFDALRENFDNVVCLKCTDKKNCLESIIESQPDKVFIALHGSWGENGQLQAALDIQGIDYTGSNFEASAIAMNKFATKSLLNSVGLPSAKAVLINGVNDVKNINFYPVCLKPNKEGSSVGVEFAYSKEEALKKFTMLNKQFGEIIAEEKLNGRELTISIFNDTIFPIIEIKPRSGFYDYKNKYTKGATEYIVPANLDADIEKLCKIIAHKAYKTIGCSGCARVDILLQDNVPYILEINTIPGMTETSLVPQAAKEFGIEFSSLVKTMIEE
jgi:D-alanine-D-alanine ligase